MTRLPRPSGKELIAALQRAGFEVARIRAHSGETNGPGLLQKILRDCDLTVEDLTALL